MSDRITIEWGGLSPVYAEGTLMQIDRNEDTITVVFKISKGIAKDSNGVEEETDSRFITGTLLTGRADSH